MAPWDGVVCVSPSDDAISNSFSAWRPPGGSRDRRSKLDAMPIRLGVLGCGRVFERFHLPAIDHTPSTTLVGAADVEAARLAWAASRSPRPALGRSLEELQAQTDLDALLILTTPTAHAGLAVQALEAGLHVLVEKPMALTVTEGRRMTDVARSRGRLLQVGLTRRFREPYGRLCARLRD